MEAPTQLAEVTELGWGCSVMIGMCSLLYVIVVQLTAAVNSYRLARS